MKPENLQRSIEVTTSDKKRASERKLDEALLARLSKLQGIINLGANVAVVDTDMLRK